MTKTEDSVQSVETRASTFYVWQAPGRPLTVHLSLDVVERMERQVIESFKAITQRGSEIGGVLLGRMPADQPLVVVEDYQGVSCDYARGPLYLLADPDKARLAAAIRRATADAEKGLSVVGYFRSNARRDLSMDEDDLAVMGEYFLESRQVCLLVKPFSMKPSVGGFFIWETGKIQGQSSYLQFPFRRSELTKGEYAKAIVSGLGLAAAGAAPGDGNGAGAAKPEARAAAPAVPARESQAAPAPPTPPLGGVRVSIPLVIPKREEPPPVSPPKSEVRAPFAPALTKRDVPAPPPPPLPLPARPETRVLAPSVITKREAPAPPPAPTKPEARAPVVPVIPRREPPTPPPAPKVETRTPVTPLAPKREEPAPAGPKPEQVSPPPPKPPARAGFTSLGLLREEPSVPAKKTAPEAAPPAPKREATPSAPAPLKPEPPAAGTTAPQQEEATTLAAGKAEEKIEVAPVAEGKRGKLPYAIAAVVGLILIVILGLVFLRGSAGRGSPAAAGPDAASLALRVERNAGQLLLSWNREATAVKTAQAAVLSIFDGNHREDVKLELGQLRGGSIVYSPITNDVSFKLEVTDSKGQTTNETVRVIAGRPSPAAPLGQAAPAQPGSPTPDGRTPQGTAAVQPLASEPTPGAETSPTPGGGAAPPAAPRQRLAQFRTESLAARLSPASNLPEPPRLEGQSATAPVRPIEGVGAPAPPPTSAPKPSTAQEAPAFSSSTQSPASGQPLRVGGNVQQALLVRSVTPNYPPLARQARVSGVVRVEATIGRDGRIVTAQAISGPPLLRQAATDAVRQWLYKPTTLNGQAVEVVTQVDVTFNLNR